MTTPPAAPDRLPGVWVTERDWRAVVLEFAHLRGWRTYFTWRSDHSPRGFPDVTLVRGERLIFAELKRHEGQLTVSQMAWLADLERVPGVEVFVWRPHHWAEVQAVLA